MSVRIDSASLSSRAQSAQTTQASMKASPTGVGSHSSTLKTATDNKSKDTQTRTGFLRTCENAFHIMLTLPGWPWLLNVFLAAAPGFDGGPSYRAINAKCEELLKKIDAKDSAAVTAVLNSSYEEDKYIADSIKARAPNSYSNPLSPEVRKAVNAVLKRTTPLVKDHNRRMILATILVPFSIAVSILLLPISLIGAIGKFALSFAK